MIFSYLRRHLLSLIVATFLAILLAFVSAVVFSLVGPALQILMVPDKTITFSIIELFGPKLGEVFSWLTNIKSVSGSDLWAKMPFFLIGLAGLRAFFSLSQWFLWERASELVSKSIRSDLVSRFLFLDPKAMGEDEEDLDSNLSSTLTTDIRLTREYIVHFYGGMPREILQILFYMVTLILLSPKLFVLFFIGIIPAMVFASRWGKKLIKRAGAALQDYSMLTEWIQQRLLGIETIKHYEYEKVEADKMRILTEGLFYRFLKAARMKARTSPMLEFVAIASMVVVLYYALSMISNGEYSSGGIHLSFFSTLAVLSQSAGKVGRYFNSNREGNAAQSRLQKLFDYLEKNQKLNLNVFEKNSKSSDAIVLSVSNLSAQYSKSQTMALSNFKYGFAPGKIYCLCGPSGAGKSTLIKTLLGLLPVQDGGKLMFSQNQGNFQVGYMPQQVQLVPTSIALNVAYPDLTFERLKVVEALKSVDLAHFIDSLEEGIDTVVGKEGKGVSGGQAQRILLARLAYHRPPLVLVDEGTSSLDPESEEVIYRFLRELAMTGSTIIMIAHRLSAIEFADEILLFDKGELQIAGPKKDVINSNDFKKIIGSIKK